MTKLLLVAGTRPEAIKMAPIIKQLQNWNVDFRFVWSGQHHDYNMSRTFFQQLPLPEPDDDLDVRGGTHSEQTARIMLKLEKVILLHRPSIVVAEGDTNTVVAAAMTSVKCLVPFAHVEAGLRSWNMAMPEEVNRKIADSIASLHFAPTKLAVLNLVSEGVSRKGLHLVGNTIVDIMHKHVSRATKIGENILTGLNLQKRRYILVTLHRAENTDSQPRLRKILIALAKIADEFRVVYPVHPRTKGRIAELGLERLLTKVTLLAPLGYWEFLGLLMNSRVAITDSGGVQEEACVLGVPTVTLRYSTERPETLLYQNVLAGAEPRTIANLVHRQMELPEKVRKTNLRSPFGDGRAGERIAKSLRNSLDEHLAIREPDLRKVTFEGYRSLRTR
jgi:UDP-N-acetylglucosamine 2-epimerase (non-hydrolysing)